MAERNFAGLRERLFDEWDALVDGRIEPSRAKASGALAMTLLKSVEVEMAFRAQQVALAEIDEPTTIGDPSLAELPSPKPAAPRLIAGKAQSGSR